MLLLDAAAGGGAGSGLLMIVVYLVVIGGMMYFMAIKPQKKQQKAHQELMDALEVGDYVCTTSGFYGSIITIDEDMVIVEFGGDKHCRIPMKKDAIVEVEKAEK